MNKLAQKARDNLALTLFMTVGAAASVVITLLNVSGKLDSMVVSEAELAAVMTKHSSEPHIGSQTQIDALKKATKCQSIDIQISIIEQQIWQMEQAEDDSLRLVEKKTDLENLKSARATLRCGALV